MSSQPTSKFSGEAEPVIPYADERNLDTDSLAILTKTAAMLGVVPNAARTYLHRPDIAKLIQSMYFTIVQSDCSNLDIQLKTRLGVICSSVNGCVYCTSHQCSLVQRVKEGEQDKWGLTNDELLDLISGRDKGKNEVERLCFEFARSASLSPAEVSVELLERMKSHLSSAQIVELGCVVAMWKFFNTMHDSLHIPSEGVMSNYSGIIAAGRANFAARGAAANSG
jgi:alkylhydroperoxidase family enzyme